MYLYKHNLLDLTRSNFLLQCLLQMLPYDTHFSFQLHSIEMDSDDDVQEIDPPVITRSGHKKYRRRILKE
jgi:hypothetical protein